MRFKVVSVMTAAAFLVVASEGFAAPTAECEGTEEQYLCLSLPEEAPESVISQQAPVQEAMPLMMVSEADLTGEAADFTVLATTGIPEASAVASIVQPNRALLAAAQASERIKMVETFLRSGPAGNDGIVRTSDDKNR